MQCLEDVPRALVASAVGAIVRRGVTWMPKPGELKAECARIRRDERSAAARRHLADCPHSGHFVEVVAADGVERAERRPCWKRAQAEMDAIGAPVSAPLQLTEGEAD